ncbi:hypothetical protein RKD05_001889 [Microbacterium sp. SLBN-111]
MQRAQRGDVEPVGTGVIAAVGAQCADRTHGCRDQAVPRLPGQRHRTAEEHLDLGIRDRTAEAHLVRGRDQDVRTGHGELRVGGAHFVGVVAQHARRP